jgi:hypothetical protein
MDKTYTYIPVEKDFEDGILVVDYCHKCKKGVEFLMIHTTEDSWFFCKSCETIET